MSMTQPKIMICDGYNLLHRARGGFQLGDFNIAFNFFRGFRALVELHKPTRVYFVLEGCPKARFETLLSYKANRIVDESSEPEKYKSLEDFHRQKKLILDLMTRHLPVSVVRHQDFEGDDVIYNLIKRSSSAVPWVVVSNDTDFTQLLNEFHNVSIYNPIAKTFVSQPDFCYVTWKALRGDGSDNIPGIPGVGPKTAAMLHVVASSPAFTLANDCTYYGLVDDIITSPFSIERGRMRVASGALSVRSTSPSWSSPKRSCTREITARQ
jgi:DNA polymerase-1